MKLLLDENLPKRLKSDFIEHDIFTVYEVGWSGTKNGKLLQLMIDNQFDALLTFDKNLQHQQNFAKYQLPVLILNAPGNDYNTLRKLVPTIKNILLTPLGSGGIIIQE